jgi:hypothetical protein
MRPHPAPLNVQRSWPQVMYAYIYIHIHCFLLICHSGPVWPLQEGFSGDVQAPGQQPSDHSMPALCSLEEDLHSSCFMGPAHHRSDECEHGQYVIHFASFFFLSQISVAASAETPATSQSLYSRVDTLEQKVDMVLRLLNSLCSRQGIDTSTIPGYSNLPPLHRSVSPSITAQSASPSASPQVPMSALTISDSRSNSSSMSDLPGEYLTPSYAIFLISASYIGRISRQSSAGKCTGGTSAGSSRHSSASHGKGT